MLNGCYPSDMKLGPRWKGHKGCAGWLNWFLNVKAEVAAFNQEEALVEPFYVIVKSL